MLTTVMSYVSPKAAKPSDFENKKSELSHRIATMLADSTVLIQNNIKLRKEYSSKLENASYMAPFTANQVQSLLKKTHNLGDPKSRQNEPRDRAATQEQ